MIAFITDWGEDSYYVSSVKSVIKNINKNAEIVDITHSMNHFDIFSYSHILFRSSKDFEESTIFLVVIDPTVGSKRKAILLITKNPKYYFIAPDNGVLTYVAKKYGVKKIINLNNKKYFWKNSNTFHGRDIFGAFAGYLSKNINEKYFGNRLKELEQFQIENPEYTSNSLIGYFVYEDSFGNIETNIELNDYFDFDKENDYFLSIDDKKYRINFKNYYSEEYDGYLLMHFDSSDYLEISLFKKSAASFLNVSNYPKKFEIKKVK